MKVGGGESKNCWSREPPPKAGEQSENGMLEIKIMELGQCGIMPRSSSVIRESGWAELGRRTGSSGKRRYQGTESKLMMLFKQFVSPCPKSITNHL